MGHKNRDITEEKSFVCMKKKQRGTSSSESSNERDVCMNGQALQSPPATAGSSSSLLPVTHLAKQLSLLMTLLKD